MPLANLNDRKCPHLRQLNLQIFLMFRAAYRCNQSDQMESYGTGRAKSLPVCSPSAVLSTWPEQYNGIDLLRIPSLPNLIQGSRIFIYFTFTDIYDYVRCQGFQHNCMHLTWTAQVLCRNPIPPQFRCVTGTTQGISHRFGAFGQSRNPTTAVTQGLSLLYPLDAGQYMNAKHTTAGSPLEGIRSQTLLLLLPSII